MAQKNTANNKLNIPLTEKLKAVPEIFGVRLNEEPSYEVLKKEGDIEVRQYEAQLLAHYTSNSNDYESFKEIAFKKLASFIFGGNKEHENVSMTAPVLLQHKTGWTMTFILPKKFSLANAPEPFDPEVEIEEVPPYVAAVISYSGNNTPEKIEENGEKLEKWIAKENLAPEGSYFSAQYDAPFVIPALKHNEVQIKVVRPITQ